MSEEQRQYHFYAVTGFCWATADTVSEVMKKLERATKECTGRQDVSDIGYALMRVPLPQSAQYKIKAYTPQVEGVTELDYGNLGK